MLVLTQRLFVFTLYILFITYNTNNQKINCTSVSLECQLFRSRLHISTSILVVLVRRNETRLKRYSLLTYLLTYLRTYLLTYLLTPWCRVLLEKVTGLQLVKKFPAFHGIRKFITALTSVHQLSLSWTSPIQSIYTHPTSWRSVLILSTHLRLCLPICLFSSGFPTKTLFTPLLTHTRRMPTPSHSSRFYHPHKIEKNEMGWACGIDYFFKQNVNPGVCFVGSYTTLNLMYAACNMF